MIKKLPLRTAYQFGVDRGFASEVDSIRGMPITWDLSWSASVRAAYMLALFEQKGILKDFMQLHWPEALGPKAESRLRMYPTLKARYEQYLAGETRQKGESKPDAELEEAIAESSGDQEFAAEADLRDYLAYHLDRIEPGLTLYEKDGRSGIEYPVESGRIDILAVDRTGTLVVIELKVSRGRSKVVGQLLYYMGWVDEHLSTAPCRGMIIASDIPEDLKLAVRRVNGISLRRYRLSVSVRKFEDSSLQGVSLRAFAITSSYFWRTPASSVQVT